MFEYDNKLTEIRANGGYQLIVMWHYNAGDFYNGMGRVAVRHPRYGGYGNYFKELGPETTFSVIDGMTFNEMSLVAQKWLTENKDKYIELFEKDKTNG